LLHRTPIRYPPDAIQAKAGGLVVVELTLDSEGIVSDARIISGPQEFRRVVLESALQWHYLRDESTGATVQATIEFRPPEPMAPLGGAGRLNYRLGGPESAIESIDVSSLPEPLQTMVRAKLAPFLGQPLTSELMTKLMEAAREVDRHLTVAPRTMSDKTATVAVLLPGSQPASPAAQAGFPPSGEPRIPVGGGVQAAKLIQSSPPEYPPLALQARIQGTVRFNALIGKDGHVLNLQLISGHPLLVPAAQEAAKKYVYQPTLLNGQPVEVITQIDVNFILP
jgi:TonB family protein